MHNTVAPSNSNGKERDFTKVPNPFIRSRLRYLTNAEKSVWLVVAMHIFEDRDDCWPSQSTIAEMAGVSRQHVCEALQSLEKQGLLISQRRGRGKSYTLPEVEPVTYTGQEPVTYTGQEPVTRRGHEEDKGKKTNLKKTLPPSGSPPSLTSFATGTPQLVQRDAQKPLVAPRPPDLLPSAKEIAEFWCDILPGKMALGLSEDEVLDRYPRYRATRPLVGVA